MKHLLILLLLFEGELLLAQEAKVRIVFNNFNDMRDNQEMINRLKAVIASDDILNSISNNSHIRDKNILIQVSFFDPGYLGELKLSQEHSLTSEGYIEEWKNINSSITGVLFLFIKSKGSDEYLFNKMHSTPLLEDEYLLPLISEYINEKLSGDPVTIASSASQYLAKALVPVWNDQKMEQAENLIYNNRKYEAGHINRFHGWFPYGFFNLKPATTQEVQNMKLVNCWSDPNMSDKNWYFSSKYIFTSDEHLQNFNYDKIFNWNINFESDKIKGVYVFKDAFLYNVLTYLEGTNKHHSSAIASSWHWTIEKSTGKRTISDFSGFDDREESDKLILYFDESNNSKEGEPIPKLSGSATNTWCNIFACDLANEVLFGNIFGDIHNGPWGGNQCANALHYRISNDQMNFKEVSLEEAWVYTLKGFVVYLTMFNKEMSPNLLNASQQEINLCGNRSGHIATCFPEVIENTPTEIAKFKTNNYIIQAGAEIGLAPYSFFLGNGYDGKVKAHIYLGYLLK